MTTAAKAKAAAWVGLAAVLASVSTAATIAAVLADSQPLMALKVWPLSADAAESAADSLFGSAMAIETAQPGTQASRDVDPGPLFAEASRLAIRSLQLQALQPESLRILALSSGYSETAKFDLLRKADSLSRRDPLTQLYLIENSAKANEPAEVLAHYDALLRRRTAVRDLAGQLLARAVADPQIGPDIDKLLRRSPPWDGLLFHYLMLKPESWTGFVAMHKRLAGTGIIPLQTSVEFTQALAAKGRFEDANEVAASAGATPIAHSGSLEDTSFYSDPGFPGNWTAPDPGEVSLISLSGGGGVLEYSRGASGTLVRRLIALRPGVYTGSLSLQSDTGGGMAGVELPVARLACAGEANARGTQTLSVTGACPYQWLSIAFPSPPTLDGQVFLAKIEVVPKF